MACVGVWVWVAVDGVVVSVWLAAGCEACCCRDWGPADAIVVRVWMRRQQLWVVWKGIVDRSESPCGGVAMQRTDQ
jgi:hypothetical protein